jgi:thiamine pyrophosphate-dependent acetolactate synthase large subunit-like protein
VAAGAIDLVSSMVRGRVMAVSGWGDPPALNAGERWSVADLGSFVRALRAAGTSAAAPPPELADLRQAMREQIRTSSAEAAAVADVLDVIGARLRRADVLVCDGGEHTDVVGGCYVARQPRTVVFSNTADRGGSIPGALAVKAGLPAQRVVALCTRSALLPSAPELETSVRSALPIVVVVLPDPRTPWTATGARRAPAPACGSDLVALVSSLGTAAVETDTLTHFDRAFREACGSPLTTVVMAPLEAREARRQPRGLAAMGGSR